MNTEAEFWRNKPLADMDPQEWESLCDGCGYCCLVKLQDEDDESVYTTNVSCRLLDNDTCRCRDYPNRQSRVSSCLVLGSDKPDLFGLLPETCAYRCLHEGRELPEWHPLLSHDPAAVKAVGICVCEFAISEEYIHPEQLQEHVMHRLR